MSETTVDSMTRPAGADQVERPPVSAPATPARPEPWGRTGVILLVLAVLLGATLRLWDLGGASFSDDEVYKVRAVEAYRQGRWTRSGDDEHPLAMKLLIYTSYAARDVWNGKIAAGHPRLELSLEAATRLPNAVVGSLIVILLAFLGRELFGRRAGLLVALLWAVELNVVGYNRIAKEDTPLAFFVIWTMYFMLRAKHTAEAGELAHSRRYEVFAAMTLGGLVATKYFLHYTFVPLLFYYVSRKAGTVWHVPAKRWGQLIGIAFVTFLCINPTVFHPENLAYIREYIGHRYVYHRGYIFLGDMYMNNVFVGPGRVPWYFYPAYLGLKLALPVLLAACAGLLLAVRRRREDGPRLLLIWLSVWFTFHAVLSGAKWGRFITHLMPAVLLLATMALDQLASTLARLRDRWRAPLGLGVRPASQAAMLAGLGIVAITPSLYAVPDVAPHYRMYLNALGGEQQNLLRYFPHCDFYDLGLREALQYVCARAEKNAQVRAEPLLAVKHYINLCQRPDIKVTTMSKPNDGCEPGRACYHVIQEGRLYYETRDTVERLHRERAPDAIVRARGVRVAEIYGPGPKPGQHGPVTILAPGEGRSRLAALARSFGNAFSRSSSLLDGIAFGPVLGALASERSPAPEGRGIFRFASRVIVEENGDPISGTPSPAGGAQGP